MMNQSVFFVVAEIMTFLFTFFKGRGGKVGVVFGLDN